MCGMFDVSRRAAALTACAIVAAGCSSPADPPAAEAPPAVETPASPGGEEAQVVIGRAPVSPSGLPTIVMLVPGTERAQPVPSAGRSMMDQMNQTFIPGLLVVQTGQPVEFKNSEDVLHNVRVRNEDTKEAAFNVALPTGGTYEFTFKQPGFYDVGCDIHPGMSALIVAAPTPHAVVADQAGRFTLPEVPAGEYTAVLYVAGVRSERTVQVGAGTTELDLTGA